MNRTWYFVLILLTAWSCGPPSQPSLPIAVKERLDWEAIARKIAERLAPEAGERILIAVKGDRFSSLVQPLRQAIYSRGAVDLGTHDVAQLALSDEEYAELLKDVDAMIILPGPEATDGLYRVSQNLLRQGRGRTIHFHWVGAIPMPGGSLPDQETIDRLYQRALLETDYAAVSRAQTEFKQALMQSEVRVTTPAGTDLRFRIGDRPITLQNGDASAAHTNQGTVLIDREIELPCGAIRVAPLEESVQGTIVFPAASWGGSDVGPVTLHFENGVVTSVSSDNDTAVLAEIDSNPGARAFREFALGFNPLLAIPSENPWIPYYGYGAGVIRLSLGDNSELGGRVTGGYRRWNFFALATVTVDEEVWVRDGRLRNPKSEAKLWQVRDDYSRGK